MTRSLLFRLLVAVAVGAGALITAIAFGDVRPLATAVPFGLGWFGGATWRTG